MPAHSFLIACVGFLALGSLMARVNTGAVRTTSLPHGTFSRAMSDSGAGQPERAGMNDSRSPYRLYEKKGMVREVSAYNSVPGQTDSSPCTSADGTDICRRHQGGECIVAANAYPLKTRLRIDKVGICTVADRTHARNAHRVDLFMDKDVEGAIRFGVRKLTVIEMEEDM